MTAQGDAQSCRPCHQQLVQSYKRTAHSHTSSSASPTTIKGDLRTGHNVLRTGMPGISFRVEQRQHSAYVVAINSQVGYTRSERIDIVIGSGRIGQTYLYWKNGMLFELPVSYLVPNRRWINSPGYVDWRIDFERPIVPRCLECHSTAFAFEVEGARLAYSQDYVLGIQCSKCHGDAREHIAWHRAHPGTDRGHNIVNPANLSRERQLDVCALCHSGIRPEKQPAFSFRPGQVLDDYLGPSQNPANAVPDVHGDQIGLLQRSKCFQSNPDMTCVTCHDVHRPQRNVVELARKCLQCHDARKHRDAASLGARLMNDCIDCHMPNRPSQGLQVHTATTNVSIYYRTHVIGIYRDSSARARRSPPPSGG